MSKKIVVELDLEGGVVVDAIGFKDGSCKQATSAMLKAFSGSDAKTTDKPEAAITPSSSHNQAQTNGR